MFAEDKDEIQNVYVDVLSELYNTKMKQYQGRASLATWLTVVSRGIAIDYLRKKLGRRRMPEGYEQLGELERKIFQLRYVEGLSYDALIHTLNWRGEKVDIDGVVEAIDKIEDTIDGRYLNRLDNDLYARRSGIGSARLAEYIIQARADFQERVEASEPEWETNEKGYREVMERMRSIKAKLSDEERDLLRFRFEKGWDAKRISRRMKYSQRRVYSAINKLVGKCRALYKDMDPNEASDDR